jgi:hypothetical protein
MTNTLNKLSLIAFVAVICLIGCRKKDNPPIPPTVTTAAIAADGATSANGGGNITSTGNSPIIRAGLCFSSTNPSPAITDDTTYVGVTSGSFNSVLTNLQPSTKYYVRAYATNEIGTGYGDVVDFTTGNAAPIATNVTISGTPETDMQVTAAYTYSDAESDSESGTTFQWYRADNSGGAGKAPIDGATSEAYIIQAEDKDKFISVGVIPKAAAGTVAGTEVQSSYIGPIGEATTITFIYNGAEVTYGILTSPVTGRKWLDRNIGAPNTPATDNDWANFGDLFQWGRGADGHQLITRAATAATSSGINGTTTTLSAVDNPGHSQFILNPNTPNDWRDPQNNNLWTAPENVNNPCPSGWHIPTEAEWIAENLNTVEDAYTALKITRGGRRSFTTGSVSGNNRGEYWSSTVDEASPTSIKMVAYWSGSSPSYSSDNRASGLLCRCIKDQ